jgi:hypothetical protein
MELVQKSRARLAALCALVVGALVMGVPAARAEAVSIPLQEIELDWTTFAGTLATAIAGVVAVAIGVGIGIWMLRLVYRMFRSFARG